jgi:flagellar protein FlgJ
MAGGVTGIGYSDRGLYSGDISGTARRAKEAEGETLFADLLRKVPQQEAASPPEAVLPRTADSSGRPDVLSREYAAEGGERPAALSAPARPAAGRPVVDKSGALYEQCQALETFLIKNLLSSMRNTVQKSGLMDGGFAGKMYEDMLYDEYAGVYAKNAGFGFAELAYLELTGQRGKVITR